MRNYFWEWGTILHIGLCVTRCFFDDDVVVYVNSFFGFDIECYKDVFQENAIKIEIFGGLSVSVKNFNDCGFVILDFNF